MKKFATVTVAGQKLELDAPGLKIHRKVGREPYVIWNAPPLALAAGFLPKSVRLHPNWNDPSDFERIAAACRDMQQKALTWLTGGEVHATVPIPGSLGALVDLYQTANDSPLRQVKASTEATYRRWLKLLSPFVATPLAEIDRVLLMEWFTELGTPVAADASPRDRRASSGIQILRLLFRFGAGANVDPCVHLFELAMDREFDMKVARREPMTYELASRFIDYALSVGEARIALAQACQSELGLRQAEVIGEWTPIGNASEVGPGDIIFQRQRWGGGLTFEMLDGQRLVRGSDEAELIGDLRECPLVELCLLAIAERRGPFVVRGDGRPFDRFTFSRHWRAVATAAGIPPDVWNMDSRRTAGGC
ncbi:hypothetical protein [Kaistia terrae]|uniref:Core-binding (CB) domain-containing protein n=1 Tax=Kaistia terrae TaxID=537017 RepID=A0ABW0PYJ5_9HYPH|nr:hypothetical protein [Kaistia terrae]MCX5580272.1 hypothetical protein [Kaistia terrae]